MSTSNKKLALIARGKYLVHGQKVNVTFGPKKVELEGAIHLQTNGVCHLLQNEKEGSTPPGFYGNPEINMGYRCGWQFNPNDALSEIELDFSALEDAPKNAKSQISTRKDFSSNGSTFYVRINEVSTEVTHNDERYTIVSLKTLTSTVRSNGERKALFSMKSHPDCCGATLLYAFSSAKEDQASYSPYRDFTDKDVKEIKRIAGIGQGASKIAHLANYQHWAQQFLIQLGFKKVHEFRNRNSGNQVSIYQYD